MMITIAIGAILKLISPGVCLRALAAYTFVAVLIMLLAVFSQSHSECRIQHGLWCCTVLQSMLHRASLWFVFIFCKMSSLNPMLLTMHNIFVVHVLSRSLTQSEISSPSLYLNCFLCALSLAVRYFDQELVVSDVWPFRIHSDMPRINCGSLSNMFESCLLRKT